MKCKCECCQLRKIKKELKKMNQSISDLKARFEAKAGELQSALSNIQADIQKLQQSSSLTQEDKDALASIGDRMDALVAAAGVVADLEQ